MDLWPASIELFVLETYSHVPAAAEFTENMRQGTERAKECLERAQQRQKAYADLDEWDVKYKVGEGLMLNTKNVHHRSPGAPKFIP